MEAGFKSIWPTRRSVTPLLSIFLKMTKILYFAQKVPFTITSSAHFQQFTCLFISLPAFPIHLGKFKFSKKNRVMLLKWCVRDAYFS